MRKMNELIEQIIDDINWNQEAIDFFRAEDKKEIEKY